MNKTPEETHQFGVMRAPCEVIFGNGQRGVLGEVVAPLGSRALVCTDERFAPSAAMDGILATLRAKDIDVRVFDGTLAELPAECIHACVDQHRAYAPQVVIGVGGGSCMDLAKLVALLLTHGGSLDQY
jgi:alcohol dehydrogenase class IV